MRSAQKRQKTTNPQPVVQTCGQRLPDGSVGDLVLPRGSTKPRLVRLVNSRPIVADEFAIHGVKYTPAVLDNSWLQAIRLPERVGMLLPAAKLYDNVCSLFQRSFELDPEIIQIAAAFAISTWFTEALPIVPSLWIVAPRAHDGEIMLKLLSYVCRRALRLADCKPATLSCLPPEPKATILFEAGKKVIAAKVLRLTTRPGCYLPHNGRAISSSFATVVVSNQWPSGAIQTLKLAVPPGCARHPAIDQEVEEHVSELQADLLRYRLEYVTRIRLSSPSPLFTSEMQLLTASLVACLNGSDLEATVTAAMQNIDQQIRAERAARTDAIATEALLVACHERKTSVTVGELATTANQILVGRGDTARFTDRRFGSILRSLGFNDPRRTNKGWLFTIDLQARAKIHRLGEVFSVESEPQPNCRECSVHSRGTNSASECRVHSEHTI